MCVCAGKGGGEGLGMTHLDAGEGVVCQREPPQVREVVQAGELPETKATHTHTRHLGNTVVHICNSIY